MVRRHAVGQLRAVQMLCELILVGKDWRGRYAAAQRWYHFIFDPTANEQIDTTGVPPDEVACTMTSGGGI